MLTSKRRQSLVIGLLRMLVLVWTFTERTSPLESAVVLRTLPIIHEPLGAVESAIITMSPGEKLLLCLIHFCLSCIASKYSDVHLFQKSSAMYCTCLHLLLMYRSDFSNRPGGKVGLPFNRRIWFGVSASKSLGSSETLVSGRSLSIASTSQNSVCRPSSSSVCCPATEVSTLRTERIRRSQTPPWCEAAGVLKRHSFLHKDLLNFRMI